MILCKWSCLALIKMDCNEGKGMYAWNLAKWGFTKKVRPSYETKLQRRRNKITARTGKVVQIGVHWGTSPSTHTHTLPRLRQTPSDSLDCQPQIQLIVIESWRVSIHKYLRLPNAEVLKPLWQYRPVFTMYNWAVSFLGFYWDFIEKETRGNKLFHNNYLAMFRCSASGKQCESMPGMFVYVWGKEALMQKLFMCRRPAACVTWATFEKRNPAIQISKIFHSMLTAGISV